MKNSQLSILTIVLITFSMFAISPLSSNAQRGGEVLTDIDGEPYTQGTQKTAKGSPFLFDDWMPAIIFNNADTKYEDRKIRIDTHKQNILLKRNDGYVILNPREIKKLVLPGRLLTFKNGFESKEHNISKNIFMEIIYDGNNVALINHHNTKLVESRGVDPITGKDEDKYISDNQLYLIDSNGSYHEIKKLKDKFILPPLSDHKKELEKYAKKNDLSFKEKNDVAKILAHYDTLQ